MNLYISHAQMYTKNNIKNGWHYIKKQDYNKLFIAIAELYF